MNNQGALARFLNLFKGKPGQAPLAFNAPGFQAGMPVYNAPNFHNAVRFGLRLNELIYAAVTTRAGTGAFVNFKVYDKQTQEEIPDHPLRVLLSNPNEYMTETDFWDLTIQYQMLAGRAYWEKQRARNGKVIALWPLRPDWLNPRRSDGKTFIPSYEYQSPGGGIIDLDPRDLMDFTFYDPDDIYKSLSPVQVAARTVDVDNSATDFIKMMWERGALPAGLLSSTEKLDEPAVAEIRRRWAERYSGYSKWGQPAVLDRATTYQKLGFSFSEMQFPELDARSETRICMVLKVPPIIIGSTFGLSRATLTNYEVADKAWWQNILVPQYKRYADQVNKDLVPEFEEPGRKIYVRADFNEVPALRENTEKLWNIANSSFDSGLLTRNEARRLAGHAATDGGDIYKTDTYQTAAKRHNQIKEATKVDIVAARQYLRDLGYEIPDGDSHD